MSQGIRTYSFAIKYIRDNKISNIMIALALLLLSISYAKNKQTIIVKPPMMTKTIVYTENQANSALKVQWADWVASLVGNISPASEDEITAELKKMISKKIAGEFFTGLSNHVDTLRLKESEQIFSVLDTDYIAKMDVAWIYGEMEQISKRSGRGIPTPWTFEIKVNIVDGAPEIVGFSQYKGSPQIGKRINEFNNGQNIKTAITAPIKKPTVSTKDSTESTNE